MKKAKQPQLTVTNLPTGAKFENEFGSWCIERKGPMGVTIRPIGKKVVQYETVAGEQVEFSTAWVAQIVSHDTPVDRVL